LDLVLSALVALGLAAVVAAEPKSADTANPFGRKYPPRVYTTSRLEGKPPAIDGRLDDEAWKQGEWAGGYTQQAPTEGALPTAPTELKILYDDKHLYFAIRAHDDPDRIHRYPGRRDDFQDYAVDVVGICFDSYNDKRTGFEFDLTAGGGKIDLILGNGETEWDTTWDAVWDGKVTHDADGWSAEFRVPLNQLRFGRQKEQVWGMHAWRWIARNQEESQWQLIPRQNTGRMYQLGELHGIRDLPPSRHVELLPHAVGQVASGPSTPGDGASAAGSLGVDAKVGLTTNFTLDATVNPDFGQVEADPSVVNLTAYETFYEEKRPFFLEGRKILAWEIRDQDQLFYSRRVGEAPSLVLSPGEGETVQAPQSTTILGALKVTGKTNDGLSVGVLQSFTQKEHAELSAPSGSSDPVVEPFGSYTVGRFQKDWQKGNTTLGGMVTSTHRWISDPALEFLPTQAWSGGVDASTSFGNRSWLVAAKLLASRVEGSRDAIRDLQTNPVHYFQRPDAGHLGLDASATSLSGHGGSARIARSGKGRFGVSDTFFWYSPGLDLNDVGYLRQADLASNQVAVSWAEPKPRGPFRDYTVQLSRQDQWDFGGLATNSTTAAEFSTQLRNKWRASGRFAFTELVDTRALRGGPALRESDFYAARLRLGSDSSRRAALAVEGERNWAVEGGTAANRVRVELGLRPSNRLSFAAATEYQRIDDDLQYVATSGTSDGPRWVLGRLHEDVWSLTVRANLAITPDLTVQYYGSPFLASGQFTNLRKATDTLSPVYEQRFHRYGPEEIAFRPDDNSYQVAESGGGPSYSFANPDFSFRQFRSNLVARWEWKPGSSVYVVWSQGRTSDVPFWQDAFSTNWRALWSTRADHVFLVKVSYWFSP
jgi:hypothetical protein